MALKALAFSTALLAGALPSHPASAQTARRATTVRTVAGVLMWGSLESLLKAQDGTMFTFDSKSRLGRRVLSTCEVDQWCEVTGRIDDNDGIETVTRVRKVPAPPAGH